jgi:hypothetical protein
MRAPVTVSMVRRRVAFGLQRSCSIGKDVSDVETTQFPGELTVCIPNRRSLNMSQMQMVSYAT